MYVNFSRLLSIYYYIYFSESRLSNILHNSLISVFFSIMKTKVALLITEIKISIIHGENSVDKFPGSKKSVRCNFQAAKISGGDISALRNIHAGKSPAGIFLEQKFSRISFILFRRGSSHYTA